MSRTFLLAASVLAIAAPVAIHSCGLLMNYTDSVPVGLYRETRNPVSLYVGFCLSDETLDAALRAGLEMVPGACNGGIAPILKPLLRVSQEHPLTYSEKGFFFDGKLLPNTAPKSQSKTGVALPHYPFGTYQSGLWAVSSFNRDSFDSRYFGPISLRSIRFYAVPVWTR